LSGLKTTLGPAFLTTSQRRPDAATWVAAAMAEMVLDKVGILPSRSWLPALIPRAIAGAWVANESLRQDGIEDPWAMPMGAAVAAGVATIAPMVRVSTGKVLGIPDPVMGALEDYFALKLGTEAVGMSMDQVREVVMESVDEMKERVLPAVQSIGAGSM